jgi:hypothetical protein
MIALWLLEDLCKNGQIDCDDYAILIDALTEFEAPREMDRILEKMWDVFEDAPMNPETERIEHRFYFFEPGTHREEIWHWFDKRHTKGVYYLLYEYKKPE